MQQQTSKASRAVTADDPSGGTGPLDDPRARPGSYASADLGPEPAAAAQARRLTRDALARWDISALADDAQSIASELAANAVNAATRPRGTLPAIIFAIHRRHGEIRIIVWDNGPGKPERAAPGPDAETGRGLAIIDHLASDWGWWPTPASGGKVVWAAIPDAAGSDASAYTQTR
jgi:anti-sigma regulatory factor (Ser/Thr protein kinase)